MSRSTTTTTEPNRQGGASMCGVIKSGWVQLNRHAAHDIICPVAVGAVQKVDEVAGIV
jgi:hypothetical protein